MNEELKSRLTSSQIWLHGGFILLFGLLWAVAEIVLVAAVLLQFFYLLFSGEKNNRLLHFGHALAIYFGQIGRFVTFNSEEKPFPFTSWPEPPVEPESDR